MDDPALSRRTLLTTAAAATAVGLTRPSLAASEADWKIVKGQVNQSVVPWCFKPMPVPDLARAAAGMGMKSVELCPPEHWPLLKELGLKCAIASSHGFVKGWNHVENHDYCIEKMTPIINAAADFGCPNVITFSGMRESLTG